MGRFLILIKFLFGDYFFSTFFLMTNEILETKTAFVMKLSHKMEHAVI